MRILCFCKLYQHVSATGLKIQKQKNVFKKVICTKTEEPVSQLITSLLGFCLKVQEKVIRLVFLANIMSDSSVAGEQLNHTKIWPS